MWIRNKYLRPIVGLTVAVVLLMIIIPESGTADDSEYVQNATADTINPQVSPYPGQPPACTAQECTVPGCTAPGCTAPGCTTPPQTGNYGPPQVASRNLIQASANAFTALPRNQTPPYPPVQALPPSPRRASNGLPNGEWENDSPLGRVKMSINGDKISINVEGAGELAIFNPSLCGEFTVASDGTVYGLIHSVDLGVPAVAAADMGEELLLLDGLSDIPFSIRAYSEPEVLAIKQVNFGLPTQLAIATDGEFSELTVYVQSMLTGQYSKSR